MNQFLIKDLITLLSINQAKENIRNRQRYGFVLLAGAISDLLFMNKICLDNGKISVLSTESGDDVLNSLLGRLFKHNGKSLSRFLSNQKDKLGGLSRSQMKHLQSAGLISIQQISFSGVITGRRYRLRKPDQLKPVLRVCDRVLIYGRKPDQKTAVIVSLMRIMELIRVYYGETELRGRAQERAGDIMKRGFDDGRGDLGAVLKLIRNVMAQNSITT